MNTIKNVCVYCGSGPGTNPEFVNAATAFGRTLAENGVGLVYGGGSIGLMGAVAAGALAGGGKVTGIIPTFLTRREHVLRDAQEVIVTKDMHERKQLMFDRADAFVALPGGVGTLEELVEQRGHNGHGNEMLTTAVVKVKVGNETLISAAEGNGPVNALDVALRKDLGKYQKYIEGLKLTDYRVRILNSGTEAVTRVLIESEDETGDRWTTVGVSPNIIDASFQALMDSIVYKLVKSGAPA